MPEIAFILTMIDIHLAKPNPNHQYLVTEAWPLPHWGLTGPVLPSLDLPDWGLTGPIGTLVITYLACLHCKKLTLGRQP